MVYIPPNPENGSLAEVEIALKSAKSLRASIRLLALRSLLLGVDLCLVAQMVARHEHTVRRWIRLWNSGGIDALLPLPVTGRKPAVSAAQQEQIIALLEHPDHAQQSHWTARKLHGYITKEWSLKLGYSTLTRAFRRWGFRLKVPRPWPFAQDEEARELFRQELAELLEYQELEVWFCDESGVLGDPRPRQRWMRRGEKGRVPFSGQHLRSNVVGAVNPKSGEFFSLMVNRMDGDMFQVFLDQLAQETAGRNITLVLDNATWHHRKSLQWHHLLPKYLPPYSPDLNPIERLWLVMKARYFCDWIAKDIDQLEDRLAEALCSFIDNPDQNASICRT
ncbi:IS630 family transposase [bacterium]|nr:IS630 family transposase [bacterium]